MLHYPKIDQYNILVKRCAKKGGSLLDRTGQLLGNYKLVRLLGQGGFSEVYLGEHIHLNTLAAIKILRTQLVEDNVENFRAEARTLAHLKHPNIVQVVDFGVADMTPYLVMQYALNGTLRQRHPSGMIVPLNIVVSYVKQMASALQYAHNQKLIHRDIKPENMLVGEMNQILLSDFGIAVVTASARAVDPALATGSWDPAGTVSYMAPEQIQGQTVPSSDQYALAIVAYEWLTGVLPFKGPYMEVVMQQISATPASLREKVPYLSQEVEQVVITALNKDPQRRFGRVEAFANALEHAAQISSPLSAPAQVVSTGAPRSTNSSEVSTMEAELIGPLGRIVLGTTKVNIGRAPDNTLVLGDSKVSSHHAEIRPEGQYYSLVDLGSTNGTFVNDQPVNSGVPRRLQSGDTIRVGDTRFTFEMTNALQAYSDGLTVKASPPPPVPGGSGAAYNTGYGMGNVNYGGQPDYQEMAPAPSSLTPPRPGYPQGQSSYTPPQPPYVSETQVPTYIPSSYGQSGQQPSVTPPQPQYTPTSPPLPVYNPPQGQQQKRSPVRTAVLAVIALVIILAGLGGFFIYHNNQVQVAQNNTNATATARTQANNTNATATANVQAQATRNVSLTATAVVTSHYPPFTNLAFIDPFTSSSDSQWSASSACKPGSNGYQVSIAQVGYYQACRQLSSQYSDFAFQVNMTIQSGDCGGMVFREVDNNNFYVMMVCADGTYDAGLFKNGNANWATALTQRTSSPAIHQGPGQQNIIAIVVQGNTFNLYVNGFSKNVDTFTDGSNTFSQGSIALLASDFTNPTSVVYTNAVVWTQ